MRTLLAATVAALAVYASNGTPSAGSPGATCMHTTAVEIAEGRLVVSRSEAGPAYVLVIPRPTCLNGPTVSDRVKRFSRIHLAPKNATHRHALARLVGKHVHVRGHAVPAHTGSHAASVTMSLTEIDAI